jgi:hypothetical protein
MLNGLLQHRFLFLTACRVKFILPVCAYLIFSRFERPAHFRPASGFSNIRLESDGSVGAAAQAVCLMSAMQD